MKEEEDYLGEVENVIKTMAVETEELLGATVALGAKIPGFPASVSSIHKGDFWLRNMVLKLSCIIRK